MSLDIFLSYASEDSAKAGKLARILQADGWSVCLEREPATGQDAGIDSSPSNARAVVVLWSASSVASSGVKNQAMEAKESNKLIPVLLEDARIPLSFRSLSTIDLRQWPDKQSMPEMVKFKTAIGQLLHTNASDPKQTKSAVNGDMTLSARVANFARNKRVNAYGTEEEALDARLALERCITDILVDILNTPTAVEESKIDAYVTQLAAILGATAAICSAVNFSRMSVSKLRGISHSKVTKTQEKSVLQYVNEYCSAFSEHNLRLEPDKWPAGIMLCLPLLQQENGREFAWFITDAPSADWTPTTQERLLKLAIGIQAGVSRVAAR